MADSGRLAWLDVARGGSIILVVFFHATIQLEKADLGNHHFWLVNNLFGPIRMPVFFAISGFLAQRLITQDWRAVLSRRVWLLAYLFVTWSILHALHRRSLGVTDSPVMTEFAANLVEPASEIWFILALGLYVVATKALAGVPRPLVIGTALVVSIATLGGFAPVTSQAYLGTLQYYVFFLVGCFYGSRIAARVTDVPLALIAGLGVLYGILIGIRFDLDGLPLGLVRVTLCLIGLVIGCRVAELVTRLAPVQAVVGFLGRHTLPIYLAHPFVLSLALLGLPSEALPRGAGYLLLPALVFGSIAASLALRQLAERRGGGWLYAPPALGGIAAAFRGAGRS